MTRAKNRKLASRQAEKWKHIQIEDSEGPLKIPVRTTSLQIPASLERLAKRLDIPFGDLSAFLFAVGDQVRFLRDYTPFRERLELLDIFQHLSRQAWQDPQSPSDGKAPDMIAMSALLFHGLTNGIQPRGDAPAKPGPLFLYFYLTHPNLESFMEDIPLAGAGSIDEMLRRLEPPGRGVGALVELVLKMPAGSFDLLGVEAQSEFRKMAGELMLRRYDWSDHFEIAIRSDSSICLEDMRPHAGCGCSQRRNQSASGINSTGENGESPAG